MARRQLTLDNTVAAELAGAEDTVLRTLRGRLDCDLHLRGNVLTLDGESADVQEAATVVDELVELIEQGHDVAPGMIEATIGWPSGNCSAAAGSGTLWRAQTASIFFTRSRISLSCHAQTSPNHRVAPAAGAMSEIE